MPSTLPEIDPILKEAPPPPPSRASWFRRFLGMRFLVISIGVHLLLGLFAAVWVVQTYSANRKLTFKGGPPSPNKSTRAIEHKVQMAKKQSTTSAPAPKRIVSTGLSKVTLPEMPAMPSAATAPNKMAGAGGANVGLAAGPMGAASSQSGGGAVSMFGLRDARGGTLQGTFFDLKQDAGGKPTEMSPVGEKESDFNSKQNQAYDSTVGNFIRGGMAEGLLGRFFHGPEPLYSTQIFIPTIDATKGPEAFHLADRVQPKRWIAVYRGKVIPAESGKYSFVGFADDVLAVRFNGQLTLDGSLSNPTGQRPKKTYKYDGLDTDLYVGGVVDVIAGTSYPIEIAIGERPGGVFNAFLLLEKQGVTYETNKHGAPMLPVFKLAPSDPVPKGKAPEVGKDTSWSIWKAERQATGTNPLDRLKKP